MLCTGLVRPTATLPKAAVAGETVTATTPVPLNAASCGLEGAVSLTAICPPVVAPATAGWK